MADKWKDLGEILSVIDNILDEIFTNCSSSKDCLREMLKYYLMRSDLVHDWVEITNALRKLGEEALANEISQVQLSEFSYYYYSIPMTNPARCPLYNRYCYLCVCILCTVVQVCPCMCVRCV